MVIAKIKRNVKTKGESNMEKRRVLALLLVAAMAGSLNVYGAEEAITWTNDNEAAITWLTRTDVSVDTDNLVMQEVEKQTNTNIEMMYVPSGEVSAKRNSLIAAEDVPDIFYIEDISTAQEMKKAGLLADLTDVINAVYPEFFEEYGEEVKNVPINDDGIYLMPNFDVAYPFALTIRVDWLENLGLEMPTDLESFAKVMHAFTYDDPDGNGVDDTWGLNGGWVQGYANFFTVFAAYGIAADKPMLTEDGTVTTWCKHENYLEAVKYIKALFDDGVVTPDYLTIPAMDEWAYLWNGKAGALDMNANAVTGPWMNRMIEDPKPRFEYCILGDYSTPASYSNYTAGIGVSADCENIEGVVRIMKYCQSLEGNHTLNLGVEDVMYKWIDKEEGTFERIGEYTDDAIHRQQGANTMKEVLRGHEHSEALTLAPKAREVIQKAIDNGLDWPYILTPSQVYAECGADMDQVLREMFVEMLQADVDDLETIYEQYITSWEEVGGSDWEAEMTELWKAQNQ